ncbi:Uncharacterised protein [Mycobacterium tuberculosis]|uniref:Uncharacterized protein n=1 Tax=Mycobacterium tuberculosis TaxID=1773 RepID=A0A654TBJ1_MYCTX|nr:Uncharacterised protein [Mycobacterium tuberculosis]CFE51369.1 Uncharacterised protein [Mycobacterium tuberculosis]CNL53349.1 Uncharacterised protein [Mycobacterium tuberculosis]CNM66279.1 Uncharacterised protein [Mycobacterium tuberculosis]CNN19677.1 Uncharacterised protein [Mycobacterium tuberculosis]
MDRWWFGCRLGLGLGRRDFLGCRGRGLAGILGVANDSELAADLDRVILLGDDLGQHTRGRRGDFGVDLVGRHLHEGLVEFDRVAFLFEPAGNRPLGDALTECRHLDGEGHFC